MRQTCATFRRSGQRALGGTGSPPRCFRPQTISAETTDRHTHCLFQKYKGDFFSFFLSFFSLPLFAAQCRTLFCSRRHNAESNPSGRRQHYDTAHRCTRPPAPPLICPPPAPREHGTTVYHQRKPLGAVGIARAARCEQHDALRQCCRRACLVLALAVRVPVLKGGSAAPASAAVHCRRTLAARSVRCNHSCIPSVRAQALIQRSFEEGGRGRRARTAAVKRPLRCGAVRRCCSLLLLLTCALLTTSPAFKGQVHCGPIDCIGKYWRPPASGYFNPATRFCEP